MTARTLCPRCHRSVAPLLDLTIVPCGCKVRRCASCADASVAVSLTGDGPGMLAHTCGTTAPMGTWRVERGRG